MDTKITGGAALLKTPKRRRAARRARCLILGKGKAFHLYAHKLMRRAVRSFQALDIYVEDGALRALDPGSFDFVIINLESLGAMWEVDLDRWRKPVRRLNKTQFVLMGPILTGVKLKFFKDDNIWFLERDLPSEVVASLIRCLWDR